MWRYDGTGEYGRYIAKCEYQDGNQATRRVSGNGAAEGAMLT